MSEDGTQKVCIGSVEELKKLSGKDDNTDLHRETVDDIEIKDPRGDGYPPLKRVSEVFDCWFESGSMPYAQQHYPFENQSKFEAGFPADFIAEGLDQTRGWFYTLMVISTALFDKPAFKNLIVNGMVLASVSFVVAPLFPLSLPLRRFNCHLSVMCCDLTDPLLFAQLHTHTHTHTGWKENVETPQELP